MGVSRPCRIQTKSWPRRPCCECAIDSPASRSSMPPQMSSVVREPRMESRSASRFAGQRVHFIGIGGCGMNGLASMLLDAGAIVTGSEPKPNQQTFELTGRGVKISRDQLGEFLTTDTDLVVRTAAVKDSNL